jgi:hypothetical protein
MEEKFAERRPTKFREYSPTNVRVKLSRYFIGKASEEILRKFTLKRLNKYRDNRRRDALQNVETIHQEAPDSVSR